MTLQRLFDLDRRLTLGNEVVELRELNTRHHSVQDLHDGGSIFPGAYWLLYHACETLRKVPE